MRILFISAFYPPYVVGGFEQMVRDVNDIFQQRGHTTAVLTSRFGVDRSIVDGNVHRILHLESDVQHYHPQRYLLHGRDVRQNIAQTETIIRDFQPDIVFVHVMWNLTRAVPWKAEQILPGRVVYYIAEEWPYVPDPHTAYWQNGANRVLPAAFKRLVAPIPLALAKREQQRYQLKFERVMCVSQATKDQLAKRAGIPASNMRVVHNGVEVERFHPPPTNPDEVGPKGELRLLYAGIVAPHKGIHTAVEAVALLQEAPPARAVHLTILGSGQHEYERRLRDMVTRFELDGRVDFRPRIRRHEMPEVLRTFDVLLLPSIWEEPLARQMQEAMASGLVVLGTSTGGTGELLIDGETGLVFPPGDAVALAECIRQVAANPGLAGELASTAREVVVEKFSMTRMINEMEAFLANVAGISSEERVS